MMATPRVGEGLLDRLFAEGAHEFVPESPQAVSVTAGFAIAKAGAAAAQAGGRFVLCATKAEAQEYGSLYGLGLGALDLSPSSAAVVQVRREKEALWAAEEALGSKAVRAVVLWLPRQPRLYDFSGSRRLKLRAQQAGALLLTVCPPAVEAASAVTARWRLGPLPSRSAGEPSPAKMPLVGPCRLRLVLVRGLGLPPQCWEIEYDAPGHFGVAQSLCHRAPAKAHDAAA